MAVVFTQYMRPDGRPVPIEVQRDPAIEEMAAACRSAGVIFEAEVLQTEQVSLEALHGPDTEQDGSNVIAWAIVPNGPEVGPAVDTIVREAHRKAVAA